MARDFSKNSLKLEEFLKTEGNWELLVSEARRRLQKSGLTERFKSAESLVNEAAWSLFKKVDRGHPKYQELLTEEAFVKILCKFMSNKLNKAFEHWSQQKRDPKRTVALDLTDEIVQKEFFESLDLTSSVEVQVALNEATERVVQEIENTGLGEDVKQRLKDLFELIFIYSVTNESELGEQLQISRGQVQRSKQRLNRIFNIIQLEHE